MTRTTRRTADRARDRRVPALMDAVLALANAPTLEAAVPDLLSAIGIGLDWALSCLLVVDERDRVLRLVDLWAPDPEHAAFVEATRRITFAPGDGLPGRAWQQDRPVWEDDLGGAREFHRRVAARASGLSTGVFVPIRAGGSVVAVLELYARESRPVDPELLRHLEAFGAVVVAGILRLRAQAEVVEREERIRATIEGALDAVISIDDAGRITGWNSQAEAIFGWRPDEAIGRSLGDLIVPERLRASHRAGMERYLATGEPRAIGQRLELPALHRSGVEIPVELTVSAHRLGGRPSFSAFLRDLRYRRATEERIQVLARFPDEDPLPVMRIGTDGALLYANGPAERLLGPEAAAQAPRWLRDAVDEAIEQGTAVERDQVVDDGSFTIRVVPIPDQGYANVYGRDVTAQLEAERALRDANDKLIEAVEQARALAAEAEAANRAKGDFLATVSHEIRTPLNGILGMVELLRTTRLAVDERHYLETMRTSGDALLAIINEILDFARIEAGRVDVDALAYSPRELLEQVAALHRPNAEAGGLSLTVEVAPTVPDSLVGDPALLGQAIGNLVANAVKFTRTGSVAIRSSVRGSHLFVSVVDTGSGIDAEDRERLFEPFVRLGSPSTRSAPGTGLGLPITRRLVVRMGGAIELRSAPSKGSTFTIRLPLEQAAFPSHPPASTSVPETVVVTRKRRRILVVEDHPVNLEVTTTILRRMGHTIVTAADGAEAMARIERGRLDLILLDCQLPDIDGYEVARRIRKLEASRRRRRVPVVAVTAHAFADARARCLAVGMDDYIVKPFRASELEAAVDHWLESRAETAQTGETGPVASGDTRAGGPAAPGVLGELAEIAGPEAVRDMVELFIETSTAIRERLETAVDANDRATVVELAHSLRGGAGTVGAEALQTACADLERAASTSPGPISAVEVDRTIQELAAAVAGLEAWRAADEQARPTGAGRSEAKTR